MLALTTGEGGKVIREQKKGGEATYPLLNQTLAEAILFNEKNPNIY